MQIKSTTNSSFLSLFLVHVVFSTAALFCHCALGQYKPEPKDTPAYKEAYALIFDSNLRAKKAAQLLLEDGRRAPTSLNQRELSLLCRVYNELGDIQKQSETAKLLWKRAPGSEEAASWMSNSLHYSLMEPTGPDEVITFVDEALRNHKGDKFDLLVLKARAILMAKNRFTEAEKRVAISDLLVKAMATRKTDNSLDGESLNFIDQDIAFGAFFSRDEREAIKVRIRDWGKRDSGETNSSSQ